MLNMTWLRLCVVVVLCVQCLCEEYTNSWAVEVIGGPEVADKIAERHDFVNLGRVRHLFFFFVERGTGTRCTAVGGLSREYVSLRSSALSFKIA